MNHQQYINQTVALALQNVEEGGKPFGAVIVKEGKVVASGVNKAAQTGDVTSHAELEAIREATSRLGETELNGAILYASGYPCPMCLSAIYLAGIAGVWYSSDLEEAAKAGLDVSNIYEELKKDRKERQINVQKLKAKKIKNPLKEWQKSQ